MKKNCFLLFLLYGQISFANSFTFDIARYPFTTRGSYLSVFRLTPLIKEVENDPQGIYLRNISGRHRYEYMIKIDVLKNGKVVEPQITASPEKMVLKVGQSYVEVCFENPELLRFRSHGLDIQLSTKGTSSLLKYDDEHLRLLNGNDNHFYYMITTLKGESQFSGSLFPGKEHTHPNQYRQLSILLTTGQSGYGEFAIDGFQSEWAYRTYEQPFDQCVENNQKNYAAWEQKFLSAYKEEDACRLASYVSWSTLVAPRGEMKREGMYMSKNWMNMIWSWDHCFNAMAMAPIDQEVAWNQMMCIFDHQSNIGSLPDGFDDQKEYWGIVKTPIHGWALSHLIHHNKWIKKEQLTEIYGPLSRWTEFWFNYRDYDRNGIPQYLHGYESFDDCSPLDVGFPLEAPELCTFLILQMDALAEVATLLGKLPEAQEWEKRSETLLAKTIERLWENTGFVTKKVGMNEWNKESIAFLQFVPLLLGEKLPLHMRTTMIANLKSSGLITSFGLSTESPRSPFFDPSSYTRGSIWAPINIFLIKGLEKCGEKELSKELARTYCNHLVKGGFPEKFGAVHGEIQADPEYTWTSSIFLILSDLR